MLLLGREFSANTMTHRIFDVNTLFMRVMNFQTLCTSFIGVHHSYFTPPNAMIVPGVFVAALESIKLVSVLRCENINLTGNIIFVDECGAEVKL